MGGALHFALSRPRLASAVTHIDAKLTEHTQKADTHLCLQPRSSRGEGGEKEKRGGGRGRRALKA